MVFWIGMCTNLAEDPPPPELPEGAVCSSVHLQYLAWSQASTDCLGGREEGGNPDRCLHTHSCQTFASVWSAVLT